MTIPTDRGFVRITPVTGFGSTVEIFTSSPNDTRVKAYAVHSGVINLNIKPSDAFVADGAAQVSVRPVAVSWSEPTATLVVMEASEVTL